MKILFFFCNCNFFCNDSKGNPGFVQFVLVTFFRSDDETMYFEDKFKTNNELFFNDTKLMRKLR